MEILRKFQKENSQEISERKFSGNFKTEILCKFQNGNSAGISEQ